MGIEPASSAWKAEVIAIIRCPHPETRLPSSFCNKKRDFSLFQFELANFSNQLRRHLRCQKVVVGEGFEPSKSVTADLQSAPFGRSGTHPQIKLENYNGAGEGTRTPALLITNQLLYQLSYTSNCLYGASEWNRTTDTGVFSPLLYQLSYRGKAGDPEGARTPDLQRDRLAF